jgi:hypothetical protein
MFLNKKNHTYQELFFDGFITLTHILIFLYILGVSVNAKNNLDTIDKYIRIYISLFLIYRFNPFRTKYEFTSLDRKMVFSAGLFMFTTTIFGLVFL